MVLKDYALCTFFVSSLCPGLSELIKNIATEIKPSLPLSYAFGNLLPTFCLFSCKGPKDAFPSKSECL